MSMQTAADIPVRVFVRGDKPDQPLLVSAERRITPSWTISQLKAKLEPVVGIPAESQRLRTQKLSGEWIEVDETVCGGSTSTESNARTVLSSGAAVTIGHPSFSLHRGSEIEVVDLRPPGARANFTDVSAVEKYEIPREQYERLTDSVLAWKKRQGLGRFDPNARPPHELAEERRTRDADEVSRRGLAVGLRCRVGGAEDGRRGVVAYVGEIQGLGGVKEAGCFWIGVELDEPVGKNDGSVKVEVEVENGNGNEDEEQPTTTTTKTKAKTKTEVRRVFQCKDKFGVFIRPEKVEVGDWPPLDDLDLDDDMEEI